MALCLCVQIELERRRLTELTVTGDKITTRIKTSRKKSGGVNAAQEQNWAVQKQIKLLENRLEKCNHKYNEALTKNNDLREHINNLRRERLVYDSIYKKLEKDLQEKKKDMANIIDICNAAYEARDAVRKFPAAPYLCLDSEQCLGGLGMRVAEAGCCRGVCDSRPSTRWRSSRLMLTRSRLPGRASGVTSEPLSMQTARQRSDTRNPPPQLLVELPKVDNGVLWSEGPQVDGLQVCDALL